MYDTVNLWLPFEWAGSLNLSKTMQSMSGLTEHFRYDGQIFVSGHLNNYKVSISDHGVSLKGSLAKYYLQDNFHTLSRSDSARAFEMMADELLLPIQKAKVSRIMDYEPEAYYPYLGDCQYFKRQPISSSLYYTNGLRQKVFYDKIAEGKEKGMMLPDVWHGQRVLRYETRYTKRLPKQFNQLEITAGSLIDEKFYMAIFDKWFTEYEAINKLNTINFNLSNMNSPKDFWKQINLMAINMIGQDNIIQEIENLRHLKAFEKPEYYSRLKKEIKALCKTPKMTASSELIAELDKKIKIAKSHYR
jgi:hypothetical protein